MTDSESSAPLLIACALGIERLALRGGSRGDATAPFKDLGLLGTTTTRSRQRGGSDHTSFNEAGLPGIGIQQDPIQYNSYTWHTNLDTYERIVEEDVTRAAIAVAGAVYHVAMRDAMLPRFGKEEMPQPLKPASRTSP